MPSPNPPHSSYDDDYSYYSFIIFVVIIMISVILSHIIITILVTVMILFIYTTCFGASERIAVLRCAGAIAARQVFTVLTSFRASCSLAPAGFGKFLRGLMVSPRASAMPR